jgi:hypothetical protein
LFCDQAIVQDKRCTKGDLNCTNDFSAAGSYSGRAPECARARVCACICLWACVRAEIGQGWILSYKYVSWFGNETDDMNRYITSMHWAVRA